jgi:transposase
MGATTNEIPCIREAGDHPDRRTVAPPGLAHAGAVGIPRRTFYRWYDRYLEGGPEALEDRPSAPRRVWNRIGDDIQQQIIDMALDTTDLSPRELAVRFTDEKRYFVSEATVYRLLKAHDLITSRPSS